MWAPNRRRALWSGYLAALLSATAASAVSLLVFGREPLSDVAMVFLLGIVVVSLRFGFRAAVLSAALSVLAFDVLFVPPYLALHVQDFRHVVTFGVMLLVAVVIAGLTQRVRTQMERAQLGEQRTALLYGLARDLSGIDTATDLVRIAATHVERAVDAEVVILTGRDAAGREVAYATDGSASCVGAALRAAEAEREGVSAEGSLHLALVTRKRPAVWMSIFPRDRARFAASDQIRLAEAFAAQIAVAVDRAHLADETERARIQVETERLRSTLLSSISHDLRTPLAVMKGAASTLVDDAQTLTPETRMDLCETVLEEIERLERLVGNVLHMTRLESGTVNLTKELQSVEELVGGALNRTERLLAGRALELDIPGNLFVTCDATLVEQVLVNLLENASKHTPPGTGVDVRASREHDRLFIEVRDYGPGLDPVAVERVFDKFYQGSKRGGGVGLGLAVCQAIAAAHGGDVHATNAPGGGAAFVLRLPYDDAPVEELLDEAENLTRATNEP